LVIILLGKCRTDKLPAIGISTKQAIASPSRRQLVDQPLAMLAA